MSKNSSSPRFSAVDYALALVVASGLAMRLIAPLTTFGLPFFDSSGYYNSVVAMQTQHVDPWLNYQTKQFTAELPMENFVLYLVSSFTGINAFQVSKFLPPLLLSVIMMPAVAAIASKLSGRRDIGLLAALLFSISDVGSLRESYALAEGIAIAVAMVYILCMIEALDRRDPRWILLSGVLLAGVFSAHNLTPFIFLLVTMSVSLFFLKNQLVRLAYWVAAPTAGVALFTAFTPLHYNIDHNPYSRYLALLQEIFSHQRAIATGKQFSNPIASYEPTQSFTYFLFLHLITILTLVLALGFFAWYILKKPKSTSAAILEVWLILAGATFVVGLTGDSLFGSANPFYGYRTWIYLMMPAAIAAAYTLMWLLRLTPKKRALLFAAVAVALVVSVPLTVGFIRQENNQYELVDAHDYTMSVWLIQHTPNANYTVYSADGFYGSANSGLVGQVDSNYFYGNFSTIFSNTTYYVVLSYTTLNYPFHNPGPPIPQNHFYNPYFDRVYASQTDWIFVYNPTIAPTQIAWVNQSG